MLLALGKLVIAACSVSSTLMQSFGRLALFKSWVKC